MAGREERQRRRFGLSRHPLSFIFRQTFRRRGNGEEEGRESDRGFIASPRNWLKYVSVSRGNSAEQGNAFRKFQPPLHPLLLALPLFARDEARRNLLLPFFRKFRIARSRNVSVNPRIDRMDGAPGIPETVSRIIDVSKMMCDVVPLDDIWGIMEKLVKCPRRLGDARPKTHPRFSRARKERTRRVPSRHPVRYRETFSRRVPPLHLVSRSPLFLFHKKVKRPILSRSLRNLISPSYLRYFPRYSKETERGKDVGHTHAHR